MKQFTKNLFHKRNLSVRILVLKVLLSKNGLLHKFRDNRLAKGAHKLKFWIKISYK